MYQELATLAENFARYRGQRKRMKYPLALWEKATQLCKRYPQKKVAESLQVSLDSLRRHLHLKNKEGSPSAQFVPINVASHPSVQIHVQGPLPITIDFDRSIKELAEFVIVIQEGVS